MYVYIYVWIKTWLIARVYCWYTNGPRQNEHRRMKYRILFSSSENVCRSIYGVLWILLIRLNKNTYTIFYMPQNIT